MSLRQRLVHSSGLASVALTVCASVASGSSASAPPPAQYFALRQAATGDCVVAVGVQAISPGDKVFGTFSSFAEAKQALDRECLAPAATPTPSVLQPPPAAPPLPAALQAPTPPPSLPPPSLPAPSSTVFASPILAVPKIANDESTEGIFFVALDTGSAFFIDRVKRSPLAVRSRSLDQNVFSVLGRAPGQAARDGDILVGEIRKGNDTVHALFLVDTTTGKMGYITDLASHSYRGELRPVAGNPAASLAVGDRNFTLVMYQGSSGKTEGAFLCHGSGRCLYIAGVGDLDTRLELRPTPPLPLRGGGVLGLVIVSSSERTEEILLVDQVSGALHHLSVPKREPWQLAARQLRVNLLASFTQSAPVATPQRFVLLPITGRSGATEHALILDVGSGTLALLEDLQHPDKVKLVGIKANLYEHLPREVARPRVMTAVPKLDESGATTGAWIFDSVTGKIVFVDGLSSPHSLELKDVEEKAR